MESPSVLPTRVTRQGLLLAASLLVIWNISATAEPTIESVPPAVLEGKSVLLLACNLPDDLLAYRWFKGSETLDKDLILKYKVKSQEIEHGKLHSGRETLYPNGSLMLQNVTLKESGIYSLEVHSVDFGQKSMSVEVFVYPLLSKPSSVRSDRTTAVEGEDTVELTCEPPFPKTSYLWQLNGKDLRGDDRAGLSQENSSLTLLKVSRHFGGCYKCEARNPLSAFRSSNLLSLSVFYGPDAPEIYPPDKYFEEGKNLWLTCQATSYPEAQYSWNVNGEPWGSRQEVFIDKVSTSNSGLYTCLANNPTTGHNDSRVKEITVVEKLPKPHIQMKNKTVLEHHLVDLTCVSGNTGISIWWTFNNERLKATKRKTFSWNKRKLTIDPVAKEDAGAYQCEVANPFISRISDPISLAVVYQPPQRSAPVSAGLVAVLVVEILASVAILGGLAYFVFFKKLDNRKARKKHKHKKRRKRHERERQQQEKDKRKEPSQGGQPDSVRPQPESP